MFQHSSDNGRDAYFHAASGADLQKHNYGPTSAANLQSPHAGTFHYLPVAHQSHHDLYGPNGLTLASYSRSATSSPLSMDEASSGPDFDDDENDLDDDGIPSRPGSRGPMMDRSKMKRFRLTHNQTRFLMSEFARQAHPDAAHRERLSREIPGLSPRQVQVWFQNRRAKLKRLTSDDRERMMRSRALPENFDTTQTLHSPLQDLSRPGVTASMSPSSYAPSYATAGQPEQVPSYVRPGGAETHHGGTPTYRPMHSSPTASVTSGNESQLPYVPVSRSSYPGGPPLQQLSGSADVSASYYSSAAPTSHPQLHLYTGPPQLGPTSHPGSAASASAPQQLGISDYGGYQYSPGGTAHTPRPAGLQRVSSHGSPAQSEPGSQAGYSNASWQSPS